ncbi:MAG: hypothetical protein A6F72_05070 [Cycloclasticus sp. symbiont of Poecilosclerida sp. N]|nr:MAG: hypothetical protein A6F72_05070 [Cycloclasticus sp. symbiont of Poecilosclerida sp. N]
MQHEGSFHLDEVKHFHDDPTLVQTLGTQQMPKACALSNRLRRMGNNGQGLAPLSNVNKGALKAALHHCKEITLDIDATQIISHKADAQYALAAKLVKTGRQFF